MTKESGARKPHYAALPLRAIGDARLTDGDLRVLCTIAAFDRLSHARGTGQGAWATHKLMAGWCRRDYSRFSTSVSKLLREGYVVREPRATNKKQYTYRVVYTVEDRLPSSKDDVGSPANDEPKIVCRDAEPPPHIVCRADGLSLENGSEIQPIYISQREEIDSVKTGKIDSAKQRELRSDDFSDDPFSDQSAHLDDSSAGAWQGGDESDDNAPSAKELLDVAGWGMDLGQSLARYERLLKSTPQSIDLIECQGQLSKLLDEFGSDNQLRGQIERLWEATWEKHAELQRSGGRGGKSTGKRARR